MALERYRQKRDFKKTPEPKGAPARKSARGPLSFVIQKHAASRLHYDFRLELDGVLKSWAVPKGPSLDPSVQRLAVHVEDHPLEYGNFEGIIPKGEYGGGTVVLWDRGRWLPEEDPKAGYRKGKLKFTLEGEKLHGTWNLVRSRRASEDGAPDDKEQWLLIKSHDAFAVPGSGDAVVVDNPESVATGRTVEEIASAGDRVWHSGVKGGGKQAALVVDPAGVKGARRGKLPEEPEPELATLVDYAPAGDEWLHEIKFDGYRALGRVSGGEARILTRRGQDWTDRFSSLARELASLPVGEALFDGEIVVLGPHGKTSFQALQDALSKGRQEDMVYYLFDLLHLDGYDLRAVPLEERKRLLTELLPFSSAGPIRASDHVVGNGDVFFQEACRLGLEGILSKRRDSRYRAGRGRDWVKVKCQREQEFVIGGFTDPAGSREGFGALLLGVYDDAGDLAYVGKVGTGFNDALLRSLRKRLNGLKQATSPFANPPRGRGIHWVQPELVCQVGFAEWTNDGNVRHPTFHGVREDKKAREVRKEDAGAGSGSGTAGSGGRASSGARASSVQKPKGAKEIRLGGSIRLSHPERVLYPESGLTKMDLARYYVTVAELMLPLLEKRPLMLLRCPEGTAGQCFFQKHANDQVPAVVQRMKIREKDKTSEYMYVRSAEGVLTLLNLGALELHTWGSRVDKVEKPDRVIFDLDPDPSVGWGGVVELALEMKRRLDALGLESFPKTTGGKGVHVVVPLTRRSGWDEVAEFSRAFAAGIAADDPGRYTLNMSKARRKGRIFIDYLRNARGATAVEAYSTRARTGAPVSTPVRWDEIGPRLKPDQWTVGNFDRRLAELEGEDPWEGYLEVKQSLTARIMKAVAS